MDSLQLDIRSAVQVSIALAVIGILLSLWIGFRAIRKARTLRFFRMRRDRMVRGWRLIFFAVVLVFVTFFLRMYAEPIAYRFFPPTPTATQTATITLTPTITFTPSVTLTPTVTPTPQVPLAIESAFESTITPNPEAVFSELIFTQGIDQETYLPLNPGTVFQNPAG